MNPQITAKMAEWKLVGEKYEFRGKCLLVTVGRLPARNVDVWYVCCEEARLHQVALMDQDGEQACNEAIGMVADRIGWLARGWIKDLKGVTSLALEDLDPARRSQ
jgi:hypothetical protein